MDLNLVLILALALLHLWAGKLTALGRIPRRRWVSFGGGVATAYIFLEILPGIGEAREVLEGAALPFRGMHQVYLLGLAGLTAFYGLDVLAARSRQLRPGVTGQNVPSAGIFWLHIGSFAIYNALFSYWLNHTAQLLDCVLLFVAIALHYVANDRNLREHHTRTYDRVGRWVLAGAILAGWGASEYVSPAGTAASSSPPLLAVVQAFLAGGLLLNVLKSELPGREEGSFGSFVSGAAAYTTILLLV